MAIITSRRLRATALFSFAGLLGLYWYGTPLPERRVIAHEVLRGAPLQVPAATTTPFVATTGDVRYTFTPHASYTLPGLVVSLHHSDSWIDISHEGDPAQTVDLCVVWGPNISTNGYQMVTYDHGDWTCYYRWATEYDPPFSGNFLSNNHLIPATPELASLIKTIHIGDQILLSGILVDYAIESKNGLGSSRNTSLIRTDGGNGACEILYLTDVKILRRNMPWREPLWDLLFVLMIGGSIGSFYLSMPKIHKRPLRDFPHTENPYDVKHFVGTETDVSTQKNGNNEAPE